MTSDFQKSDIKQLNSFLRGELSAVDTYEQALESVDDPTAERVLRDNMVNHSARATLLREQIRKLGGEPATSSGAWGALAKAIEGGAKLFGDSAAVAALEQGEDHGLKDYRGDLEDLSVAMQNFVASKLLSEQRKTHDALSRLKTILS